MQRRTCSGIVGAIITTLAVALETIFNINLLHILIMREAKVVQIRLEYSSSYNVSGTKISVYIAASGPYDIEVKL